MKKHLEYLTHIFRKITARLKNTSGFLSKTYSSVIARSETTKQSLLIMLKRTNLKEIATHSKIGRNFSVLAMTKQNKPKILFLLGMLYLFFLIFPFPQSLFTKTKLQIYGNKNAQLLHVVLADYFVSSFDYQSAKKELRLALAGKPNPEIEIKLKMVSSWETKPEALMQELISWQKITKEKSDYRDGFFQEALILYQLKRLNEAKTALKKVFFLDPNFSPGRQLEKQLL